MIGERFERFKQGVKSSGLNPFAFCKDDLQNSDLNIANLECVISKTSSKTLPFSEAMRVDEEYAGLLKENHIHIVNLANNHILDHGEEAYHQTKKALEKYGIKHFGIPKKYGHQKELVTEKIKDLTLGFLGYDLSNLNKNEFESSILKISKIVNENSGKTDLLIVSLHWGYEYTDRPTTLQIKAAEKLFNAGADIIYGHHPHILQGVAKLDGKIFIPSLGNFIFDNEREANRKTGTIKIKVDEDHNLNYIFSPYFINEKFQPVPDPLLLNHFDELNKILNEVISANDRMGEEIDRFIYETSEKGHSSNQKRVRKILLKNFYNYLPFIIPIVNEKIIKKRILKRKKTKNENHCNF